ncbi:beta-1,3-galactosyltransferase 5-like [Ciona intestinalis]
MYLYLIILRLHIHYIYALLLILFLFYSRYKFFSQMKSTELKTLSPLAIKTKPKETEMHNGRLKPFNIGSEVLPVETTTEATKSSSTHTPTCKKKFSYITEPTEQKLNSTNKEIKCSTVKESSTISLVNFVVSSAPNFRTRQIIRETSGSISFVNGLFIKHVFVVGKSTEENTNLEIIQESEKHGDVLLYDYPDNYRNLVYKTLALLQWASENLSTQIIISKTDDDVAVDFLELSKNLKDILNEVLSHENESEKNVFDQFPMICGEGHRVRDVPQRGINDKNYVSIEEYAPSTFPTFCMGPMYVMPMALAKDIYDLTCDHGMLRAEDVWFTGIVRDRLGRGDSNIVRHKYPFAQHYQTSLTTLEYREQNMRRVHLSMVNKLEVFKIHWC